MPPLSPTTSGGAGTLIAPELNDTQIILGNFAGVLNNQPESSFITVVSSIGSVNSTSGVFTNSNPDLTINNKGMFTFPWEVNIGFNITGDAGALIETVNFSYRGRLLTFTQAAANNFTETSKRYTHTYAENYDGAGTLNLGNFGQYQVSVGIQGVGTWSGSIQIFNNNMNPVFAYEP